MNYSDAFIVGLGRGIAYAQIQIKSAGADLKKLDPLKENFYQLITMGLQFEEMWRPAAELALALFKYVEAKRLGSELTPLLKTAVSRCEVGDELLHGHLLNRLGQLIRINHNFEQAKQILQESLQLATITTDTNLLASIHWNLALIHCYSPESHLEKAENHAHLALTSQPINSGKIFNTLGTIRQRQGRYEEATDYFQEAHTRLRLENDLVDATRVLSNIATTRLLQNQLDKAQKMYQEVIDLSQKRGDMIALTDALLGLGYVYTAQKRYIPARNTLADIDVNYLISWGELDRAANTQNNLGYVYTKLGEFEMAESFLNSSFALRKQVKGNLSTAMLLDSLATLYTKTQRTNKAIEMYKDALSILGKQPNNARYKALWERYHEKLLHLKNQQTAI